MLGYFSLQLSLVFSLKGMVIVRVVDEYCIVSSNREGRGGDGEWGMGGGGFVFFVLGKFVFLNEAFGRVLVVR